MKNNKLLILSLVIFVLCTQCVFAHQRVTAELSGLITMYKQGNYTECYKRLTILSKKDPTNALLYYYLGMSSAQLGKKDEAIENYEKASALAAPESNLYMYSQRGKACIEGLPACSDIEDSNVKNAEDAFIQTPFEMFSDKARSEYEKLKLDNLRREINRNGNISPAQFKEYQDYSGMNSMPSDNEIIAAYDTLKRAGFLDYTNNNLLDDGLLFNNTKNFENTGFELTDMMSESMQRILINNL